MVRQVKGLATEFDGVVLPDTERSRQAHVHADTSRTDNIVHTNISPLAVGRQREGGSIDPLIDRFRCRIGIRQYLLGAIPAESLSQRCVDTGSYRHVAPGQNPDDSRHSPAAGQSAEFVISPKSRRFIHRGHAQVVAPVLIAVSAVVTPHSRIFILRRNSELGLLEIADAVGPGVVTLNRQTVRPAMLDRKQ